MPCAAGTTSRLPTPEDVAPLFVDLALPSTKHNGAVVSFREWRRARQIAEARGSEA